MMRRKRSDDDSEDRRPARARGLGATTDGVGARPGRAPKRPLGEIDAIPVGRITGIHERRSGSARYSVSIDGRDIATVSAQVVAELGLRVGQSIDEALADRLRRAAGELAVFDKAVALLAVRGRSERDLRLRLKRAGASTSAIDRAVEQLARLGLIDDDAYARQVAHARVMGGGISKRRIGQELHRRGVSRQVAEEAIESTLEDVALDEIGAARAAAAKRMRSMRALDAATRRRRLYGFLARRGYEHEVIARVIKEIGAGIVTTGDASDEDGPDPEGGAGE